MFVKFDETGKVAELWASEPPQPEGFLEDDSITFENKDRARLVDGKVSFVDDATFAHQEAIQQAQAELAQSLMDLRGQIDLAQSVTDLTKKVDLVIQVIHQVVLAGNLKNALTADEQQRYDETVTVFAESESLMNLYDYQKSLQDIHAMYEQFAGQIQAYNAKKEEIYAKYDLTESDVAI